MVDSTAVCRVPEVWMAEHAADAGRSPCWQQGPGRGQRQAILRRAIPRCRAVESTISGLERGTQPRERLVDLVLLDDQRRQQAHGGGPGCVDDEPMLEQRAA